MAQKNTHTHTLFQHKQTANNTKIIQAYKSEQINLQ